MFFLCEASQPSVCRSNPSSRFSLSSRALNWAATARSWQNQHLIPPDLDDDINQLPMIWFSQSCKICILITWHCFSSLFNRETHLNSFAIACQPCWSAVDTCRFVSQKWLVGKPTKYCTKRWLGKHYDMVLKMVGKPIKHGAKKKGWKTNQTCVCL